MHINDLLKIAAERRASDLHIKVGSHPVIRVDGELIPLVELKRLMQEDTIAMAFSIMSSRQKEKFKKEFPKEPTYRRTLKEEAEALDTMVTVLAPEAASQKKAEKLDPSLLALIQIDHEGLLEPFVLLNRADPEIARDYPAYRDAHHDKLYRYVDEYVIPKASASPGAK